MGLLYNFHRKQQKATKFYVNSDQNSNQKNHYLFLNNVIIITYFQCSNLRPPRSSGRVFYQWLWKIQDQNVWVGSEIGSSFGQSIWWLLGDRVDFQIASNFWKFDSTHPNCPWIERSNAYSCTNVGSRNGGCQNHFPKTKAKNKGNLNLLYGIRFFFLKLVTQIKV